MKIVCIMCPVGCELDVTKSSGKITVKGNSCPRGVIYGEKEVSHPERMVTTVKQYKGKTIALKTSKPIPKKQIENVLKEIDKTPISKNMKVGDVFIKNILLTTSDIVVTEVNE